MPFVQIDLRAGTSFDDRKALSDAVHRAMVEVLEVPQRDRFQILTEHDGAHFVYDPGYLDISRGDGLVFVRITLSKGRSTETKQRFYARLVELVVERPGMRREDLMVTLIENAREDWSFGNGEAQYVTLPRERWH